jgi:hypothetical protein
MVACEWGDLQPQSFEKDDVKPQISNTHRPNFEKEHNGNIYCILLNVNMGIMPFSMDYVLVVYKT